MNDLTLKQLHELVGGRLRLATLGPRDGEWTQMGRIGVDSRQIQMGEVFWALQGRTHDGADFSEAAFARGASGVIATKYIQPWPGCWSLQVEDSREGLYRLARYNRDRFTGKLIAVGGANGTATTRRMISAVLATRFHGTHCPQRGNRLESIALGMLALGPNHQYAAFDLNLTVPGDVSSLVAECAPAIGVVTDVANVRIADTCGVLHDAAVQLLTQLPKDGHAVLNGDDRSVRRAAERCHAKILWVGEGSDCDLVATRVLSTQSRLSFLVEGQSFNVSAWGRHQLTAALCAIGVGRIFGMSLQEIARALEDFDPPPGKYDSLDDKHSGAPMPVVFKPVNAWSGVKFQPGLPAHDTAENNHILRFDAAHRPRRRAA